jgi:membrane peptidoglycan carboxypeptidase
VPVHVVRGTRDQAGRVTEPPREPGRQVIRPTTAREIGRMLEAVVRSGTGVRATVGGYRVAGKSGTAQRARGEGYAAGEYVASFGGFAPVSAPRLAALVVVEFPRGALHQGGQIAAPVFARIVGEALRYLRVPPDDFSTPRSDGRAAALASERVDPPAPARPTPVDTPEGTVPDVRGAGLREAIVTLARRGVRPIVRGTGIVVAQEPPPGTRISPGAACVLRLENEGRVEDARAVAAVARAAG